MRSAKLCRILARRAYASPSLPLSGDCKIVMRCFCICGMAMAVERSNPQGRGYEPVCRTRRQDGRLAVARRRKLLRIRIVRIVRGGDTDKTSIRSQG